MGGLGVGGRRDQDGMAGPPPIDLVERSVVLGDDDHLVLALLPGDADEPVIQEGKVGATNSAYDDGAITGGEGRSVGERVVLPSGEGYIGGRGEEDGHGAGPGEEDAEEDE